MKKEVPTCIYNSIVLRSSHSSFFLKSIKQNTEALNLLLAPVSLVQDKKPTVLSLKQKKKEKQTLRPHQMHQPLNLNNTQQITEKQHLTGKKKTHPQLSTIAHIFHFAFNRPFYPAVKLAPSTMGFTI